MRYFRKKVTKEHNPGVHKSWGRINTFCSHLKTRFKRNLDPKLKMLYFMKKKGKIAAALGAPSPTLR